MKKLITYLTAFLMISTPMIVSAEVTVIATAVGKKIKLSFQESLQHSTQGEVISLDKQKIVLKDKSGYTLFQESISTMTTPYKSYNLNKLPQGEYVFTIQDRLKITHKPFTIIGGEIELQKEIRIFKPTTLIKNKVVVYNLLAFKEAADVRITNYSGEEFYSELIKEEDSIGKRFDFSKAPKGLYMITTIIQDQTFTEEVKI